MSLVSPASRVVFISPGRSHGAWVNSIASAAVSKGFHVTFPHMEVDSSFFEETILLTEDPAWLTASGVEAAVVLHVACESAADFYYENNGGKLREAISSATQRLAAAASADLSRINWIKAWLLNDDEISLFADLTVAVPPRSSAGTWQPDAGRILCMFNDGQPKSGFRTSWPINLFIYDHRDKNSDRFEGSVDLLGPARAVISGPFFFLTKGTWKVTVTFSCDSYAARVPMSFEWAGAVAFAELSFVPGRPGRYEIALSHEWSEPEPAELRVYSRISSLGGIISLEKVEVERLS